ncbi:hypothetical protein PC116_g34960 [Phytophthora cactorum]|nr:hypothetical protein PC116_g34960 [Phytophthora cactorum]
MDEILEEPQITSSGTSVATPKVLIMMADYGHDPTGAPPLERDIYILLRMYSSII